MYLLLQGMQGLALAQRFSQVPCHIVQGPGHTYLAAALSTPDVPEQRSATWPPVPALLWSSGDDVLPVPMETSSSLQKFECSGKFSYNILQQGMQAILTQNVVLSATWRPLILVSGLSTGCCVTGCGHACLENRCRCSCLKPAVPLDTSGWHLKFKFSNGWWATILLEFVARCSLVKKRKQGYAQGSLCRAGQSDRLLVATRAGMGG